MPKQLPKLKGLEINELDYHQELVSAHTEIAILKGACFGLPNPQLLLSPTVLREALASSEVENIITTLADVLQAQLLPDAERTDPDKEVLRYNEALRHGINLMQQSLPLGSRLIREVHDTLVIDEKGYRQTQNALINQATGERVYLPPPANTMADYIADLEKYIHGRRNVDALIKTAVAHYQFEAIHPFGDGNGRTGRILIVLSLMQYNLLNLPVLFTSAYINKTKPEYYAVIKNVTDNQEWKPFISYMLTAFKSQAKESTQLLLAIRQLHENTKRKIRRDLPKIYSRDMIDTIFSRPFINPTKYGELLKVSYQTGSSHLKQLEAAGFMQSIRVGKYHFFINKPLFELINSKT